LEELQIFGGVSALAPPRHPVGISGDGVEPPQEGRVLAQQVGMPCGCEPGLLEEVFGQRLVLCEAHEKAPDLVGVKAIHLVEGPGLPRDETADDFALVPHFLLFNSPRREV
jgi:hypothetical protein